jgi:hypothetical protein
MRVVGNISQQNLYWYNFTENVSIRFEVHGASLLLRASYKRTLENVIRHVCERLENKCVVIPHMRESGYPDESMLLYTCVDTRRAILLYPHDKV